jgi:drug/metabolite transporter (DMT)-like permease
MRNETEQALPSGTASPEELVPTSPSAPEGHADGRIVLDGRDDTSAAPSATDDRPGLGIAFTLVAMATASLNDGLCKMLAADGFHAVQIAWARFLCIGLFLMPMVIARRMQPLRTKRPGLQLLRGLTIVGGSVFFVAALQAMPLADATALAFVMPFFVTALSIPILGAKVGIRRWSAIAVGFIGVLLIVRPGGAGFQAAALLPVASAACAALMHILSRMLGRAEPVLTTMTLGTLTAFVVTSAAAPFFWHPMDASALWLMLAVGAVSVLSQSTMILAFQHAEPSVLAPFVYSQIVWASLVGFGLFRALPDGATLIGGAIIIAGGLYTWHRERRLRAISPSGDRSSAG